MELEADVQVGDFKIMRRLGAGGMGVVYQARQVSLDRVVALKVLGGVLTHPGDVLRFQREARAAARLRHSGIATVYFVGQDEHACYLAMEFVDGITLRQLISHLGATHSPNTRIETMLHEISGKDSEPRRVRFDDPTSEATSDLHEQIATPLPLEAITEEAARYIGSQTYVQFGCEMIRDAARALAHAHEHGVVHRDIKPQNIMLDRQGQVRIIDFGIARFFDEYTLTNTGQIVGTPMYMSPEQVAGRHVDHRADIYSLGLTMYELLTLRRPMQAPTREAVLRGVVTKSMVPVSWKNSGVPRSVESVVHKAMAKDPDDRYQHAADFAEELQRCLDGRPVIAEPYRYKFDKREILAERPWSVTATAFWFNYVAIFYALLWLPHQIGMAVANPAGRRVYPVTSAEYVQIVGGYLSLAAASCWVATALLSGRWWARWVAVPVAVLGIGLSLRQPYQVIHDAWLHNNTGYLALMSIWLITRFAVILGGCFAVLTLVMHRRTKQWFHFSHQVRSEHEGLLTGIRSEGP